MIVNEYYRLSINTEILKLDSLTVEVDRIINFFKKNQVTQEELIHGWIPDLEEQKQGKDSSVKIDFVKQTINDDISRGQIELGRVDLWIRSNEKECQFQ